MRVATLVRWLSVGLVFLWTGWHCRAENFLRGAGAQGVFEMAGSQGRLVEANNGTVRLQYALPPGGVAGAWASTPADASPATGAHVFRYVLTPEAGAGVPLPAKWEIKGTLGVQTIPVILGGGPVSGEAILDWGRIGEWKETVLALQHPGKDPVSGGVFLRASFVRWPPWRAALAGTAGRLAGVLGIILLAAGAAALTGGRPGRGPHPAGGIARCASCGLSLATGIVALLALWSPGSSVPGQSVFTPPAITAAGILLAGLLTRTFAGRGLTVPEVLRHGLASGVLALAGSDAPVWTAAGTATDLLRVSRAGAGLFWALYHLENARRLVVLQRSISTRDGLRLVGIPFLFGLLLSLSNGELMARAGAWLLPAAGASGWSAPLAGRIIVLIVFNVVAGWACLGSWKQVWARGWDALALPLAAVAAVLSPRVADAGSGLLGMSAVLQAPVAWAATVVSQAGLWAEAYLLTGLLLDAVRGGVPQGAAVFAGYAWRGATKGMWFSGWAMGLLLAGNAVVRSSLWGAVAQGTPLLAAALSGALVFPLLKTLVESFDGSPSFAFRLRGNYRRPALLLRGAVVGRMAAWGWANGFVGWSLPARAGWGSVAVLLANVVFFGFFFVNFVVLQVSGAPLVRF